MRKLFLKCQSPASVDDRQRGHGIFADDGLSCTLCRDGVVLVRLKMRSSDQGWIELTIPQLEKLLAWVKGENPITDTPLWREEEA